MLTLVRLSGIGSAGRASCPAASSSAWRSPARWSPARACCCSTSRWARSTSAAPGDADRAEADPARGRHHHDLRHPRPGGGADAVRPHRHLQRGQASSRSARRQRSMSGRQRPSPPISSAMRISSRARSSPAASRWRDRRSSARPAACRPPASWRRLAVRPEKISLARPGGPAAAPESQPHPRRGPQVVYSGISITYQVERRGAPIAHRLRAEPHGQALATATPSVWLGRPPTQSSSSGHDQAETASRSDPTTVHRRRRHAAPVRREDRLAHGDTAEPRSCRRSPSSRLLHPGRTVFTRFMTPPTATEAPRRLAALLPALAQVTLDRMPPGMIDLVAELAAPGAAGARDRQDGLFRLRSAAFAERLRDGARTRWSLPAWRPMSACLPRCWTRSIAAPRVVVAPMRVTSFAPAAPSRCDRPCLSALRAMLELPDRGRDRCRLAS